MTDDSNVLTLDMCLSAMETTIQEGFTLKTYPPLRNMFPNLDDETIDDYLNRKGD